MVPVVLAFCLKMPKALPPLGPGNKVGAILGGMEANLEPTWGIDFQILTKLDSLQNAWAILGSLETNLEPTWGKCLSHLGVS